MCHHLKKHFVRYWYGNAFKKKVEELLCFEDEHHGATFVRIIALGLLGSCLIMGFGCFPPIGMFTYASNWPLFTMTGHVLLALNLAHKGKSASRHSA